MDMKTLLLLLCLASPLAAQGPAITVKAAGQLVTDWKNRDAKHECACLYAHRDSVGIVTVDSIGPTGTKNEMFCRTGVVRFVDEKGGEQETFSAMIAAMGANPAWLLASEVYAVLKGNFGPISEAPLALTVVRKAPALP